MCSLSKEQSILSKVVNSKCTFFGVMPLCRLRLFILYQAPHSRVLAPACGALGLFSGILLSAFLPYTGSTV